MSQWISYMDLFKAMKDKMNQCSDEESECVEKVVAKPKEMVTGAICISCSVFNQYIELEKGSRYHCYSCKSYEDM